MIVIIFAISGIILDILYALSVLNRSELLISGYDMVKYFTIQSNFIVIIYFLMFLTDEYHESILFKRFLGGVVIYIMITFIVWAISLESLYEMDNIEIFGNAFLHYATPLIVFGFLIKYRNDYDYDFKDIWLWLVYPISYLVFLIIHGVITGNYLYPFFQVGRVGVEGLLSAVFLIITLFVMLSFLLVKMVSKSKKL